MNVSNKRRFVLVNLVSPFTSHDEASKDLEELLSLVNTYGGATIVQLIQRKMRPDSNTYIGSGKAEEVAGIIKKDRIDVVVVNAIVNASQLFELQKIFWQANPKIEVWDRIDLILRIFEKHAHTTEAKLQIELARMRHMGPRMYGLGTVLSRQAGGIGTRGLGETNIELMKRHWRDEMKNVTDKLKKLEENRYRQLERRREIGLKTVSIVGYTNAGKSTLFNVLTGKNNLSKDVLFATLESTVGRLRLPNNETVIISDTIGFIQNLPEKLIDAFKSTLMEAINASLLLHVIDASDHLMNEKIAVVESVLANLGLQEKKKIYVFTKMDARHYFTKHDFEEVYAEYTPQFVSSITGEGIKQLTETIRSKL